MEGLNMFQTMGGLKSEKKNIRRMQRPGGKKNNEGGNGIPLTWKRERKRWQP